MDGRSDATSSAFVTPRPRQDMLRFQIDAFRFAGDPRSLVTLRDTLGTPRCPQPPCWPHGGPSSVPSPQIYITCHLKVTPAEQSPDAQNKACSFSKAHNT